MEWVTQNIDSIMGIFMLIIPVASAIAKLTPTEVDNKALYYILKLVDKLALNNKPTELKKDVNPTSFLDAKKR